MEGILREENQGRTSLDSERHISKSSEVAGLGQSERHQQGDKIGEVKEKKSTQGSQEEAGFESER